LTQAIEKFLYCLPVFCLGADLLDGEEYHIVSTITALEESSNSTHICPESKVEYIILSYSSELGHSILSQDQTRTDEE
jgi:hypothetical protein